MTATSPAQAAPPATSTRSWRALAGSPVVGPVIAIAGSIALVIAGMLPVWGTRLQAPQYPKGLALWFYGGRVDGPVREVNNLNHYIGMQPVDLARVPEMALWPLAIVSAALLLVVAVLWRGWLSRLALIGLWLIPVVVLADIQRWLITFGTELSPDAALNAVGSFVPLVVGPTKVWNFTVLTYPGPALILIWIVALVATLARRGQPPAPRPRRISAAASMFIAVVGAVVLVIPATSAPAPEGGVRGAAPADGLPAGTVDIAALVAAAPPGSTVKVPPGEYHTHLVVDRPVTLEADGHVLLHGDGRGTVVTITADDVTVRGFHVAHTGGQLEDAAGIKVVGASRVSIEDNRLEDFFAGIVAQRASDVRIVGNSLEGSGRITTGAEHALGGPEEADATQVSAAGDAVAPGRGASVDGAAADPHAGHGTDTATAADPHAGHGAGSGPRGQGDGISLWDTKAATIARNTFRDVRDGIYLSYADDVLVDSNDIQTSRYGIHAMFGEGATIFGNTVRDNLAGLVLMYTKDVLAGRNALLDHRSAGTGIGVAIKDVSGLRLAENVIAGNRIGLRGEGTARTASREAAVLRNRISSNGVGVALMASADLGFAANTFESNLTDVHAIDQNVARFNDWTYQGTGNRWSGYGGYDLDGDSIGDVPHAASGALGVILAADPALEALRTSPAFHALASAQGLWESGRDVILSDHAPRTDDPAPRLADLGIRDASQAGLAGDTLTWWAIGLVFALLTGLALAAARMRRTRTGS